MFLHSGASLHGHEYSTRHATAPPVHPHNLRSPLLRSAFATPKSRLAPGSDELLPRPPALKRRPVSEYIPRQRSTRTPEPVVRFQVPDTDSDSSDSDDSDDGGGVEVLPQLKQKEKEAEEQRVSPLRPALVQRPPITQQPQQQQHQPEQLQQQIQSRPVVPMQQPQQRPRALSMTEDLSLTDSELSDATQSTEASPSISRRRRQQRRAPRKSTNYSLGYPAPKLLGKKKVVQKVLPRLMLQLQQVLDSGRSKPVLEVFPATRIAGPVIAHRMAKRFPAIFGVKHQLCYEDVVLVRRDDRQVTFDGFESEGGGAGGYGDDGGLEERKLLAVYSPLRNAKDKAEIVLDDGSVWLATQLRNGSFDFVHVDTNGNTTTARWAARRATASPSPTETSSITGIATASAPVQEPRYTFSIINPLTRRHPVMATLTKSSLNVQDTYTSVTSSHGRYPPSRSLGRNGSISTPSTPHTGGGAPLSTTSSDCEGDSAISIPQEPETERVVHAVDDATKLLISVTALWVALSSGWSANYTPPSSNITNTDTHSLPGTSSAPLSVGKIGRRNTWSRTNTSLGISDSDATATPANPALKRYSMPATSSNGSTNTNNNPSGSTTGQKCRSVSPGAGPFRPPSTPSPAPTTMTTNSANTRFIPRRATSTGAAFMQRRIEIQGRMDVQPMSTTPVPEPLAHYSSDSAQSVLSGPSQVQGQGQGQQAPGYCTYYHKRTQSASYVFNPIARPLSEPRVFKVVDYQDTGRRDLQTPGTDGGMSPFGGQGTPQYQQQQQLGRMSPQLTLTSEMAMAEDSKRGVRARLSKWLHKLGGR